MDSGGEQQSGIDHSIFKQRLDTEGNPIQNEAPKKTDVFGDSSIGKKPGDTTHAHHDASKPPSNETGLAIKQDCGSCYGAESSLFKCCNTCEEVREAYRLKGWALSDPVKIEQCKGMVEDMKATFNEGCRLYGYMEVNRCSGSFHVAPGKSFILNHVHVHDVQPFSSSQFNMTHTIRSLSFGEEIAGKTNPVDGMEGVATEESTMFQDVKNITKYYTSSLSMPYSLRPSSASLSSHPISDCVIIHEIPPDPYLILQPLKELERKQRKEANRLRRNRNTDCSRPKKPMLSSPPPGEKSTSFGVDSFNSNINNFSTMHIPVKKRTKSVAKQTKLTDT